MRLFKSADVPVPDVCKHFYFFRSLLLSLTVLSFINTNAQLCNGSLGDPAVNITFGNSSGASSYVPSGSYIYLPSSCPNDGYYTITNYTSNCFNNSWYTVTGDHTGNGSFMLVNASYAPGDFFVTTVTDLCPNTTYEFAAWIMNVMNRSSIMPNITFKIETPGGVVLAQFNSGDIPVTPAPVWKQYGFFFTTPVNNPRIVLRITNNALGGIGNDIALDDITFRPCGAKINANIQGNTDTINVCEGNINSYTFDGSASSAYTSPIYQWQVSTDSGASWKDIPGANSTSYLRLPTVKAGNYWYRLTVIEASVANISSCRIASNSLIINVHPRPTVDAGPNRIILTGNTTTLAGKAEGESIQFVWTPVNYLNDASILNPVVSATNDITYTLSATSTYGCNNADNVQVKVVSGIYVPTAFTPNGDGKNDSWKIPFLDPSFGATVSLFNRNGQLVYHCVEDIVSWDGKINGILQPSGTYVYLITFKEINLMLKGTVTLIR